MPETEILFLGTRSGPERALVEAAGLPKGVVNVILPMPVGQRISDILHDPAYATSVGLLRWALKEQEIQFRSSPLPVPALGGLFRKVAHLMRVVLPQ